MYTVIILTKLPTLFAHSKNHVEINPSCHKQKYSCISFTKFCFLSFFIILFLQDNLSWLHLNSDYNKTINLPIIFVICSTSLLIRYNHNIILKKLIKECYVFILDNIHIVFFRLNSIFMWPSLQYPTFYEENPQVSLTLCFFMQFIFTVYTCLILACITKLPSLFFGTYIHSKKWL